MPEFPDWGVGTDVSAANLAYMVPNIIVKTATTARNTTTTLADDPEFSGIPLAVGTHWVKFHLFVSSSTSATPDIKTAWAFTGTWLTTATRMLIGPSGSNTATNDSITPVRLGAAGIVNSVAYGLASSTGFTYVVEECFNVQVSVAGNLSLQWAQNTSDASNVNVHAQSACQTRQIA